MVKKHAYLIMAHNEFEVLTSLIGLLDSKNHDIYLHIDGKVKYFPKISTIYSNLFVLNNRVNVFWGHVSQIEAEIHLFEAALNSSQTYSYFHLISGTHLPLKTNSELYDIFSKLNGINVLAPLITDSYETYFKIYLNHFFLKLKMNKNFVGKLADYGWRLSLKIQKLVFKNRINNKFSSIMKANNWVSLSEPIVSYIVDNKNDLICRFKHSYCGDEYLIPFILNKQENFSFIYSDTYLFNEFEHSNARVICEEDVTFLVNSNFLFARKFSHLNNKAITKLEKYLQDKSI